MNLSSFIGLLPVVVADYSDSSTPTYLFYYILYVWIQNEPINREIIHARNYQNQGGKGSEVGLFGLRGGEVVQEGSVLLETPFYFVVEHVLPTQHR